MGMNSHLTRVAINNTSKNKKTYTIIALNSNQQRCSCIVYCMLSYPDTKLV